MNPYLLGWLVVDVIVLSLGLLEARVSARRRALLVTALVFQIPVLVASGLSVIAPDQPLLVWAALALINSGLAVPSLLTSVGRVPGALGLLASVVALGLILARSMASIIVMAVGLALSAGAFVIAARRERVART